MNGVQNKLKSKWFGAIVTATFSVFLFFSVYKPQNVNLETAKAEELHSSEVSLLIVGDMMLDRNVRNIIDRKGFDHFFEGIKPLVQSVDIAVANLEGAFTDNPSVTASLIDKSLVFTFDPALAPALSSLGFDVLGLANNHSFNFGKAGMESTRRYITAAGMFYYGDPFNKDEISTVVTKNGIRVGFIGFHEFYYVNSDNILFEIARLRKEVDVLIVSPHWGAEYQKSPNETQVKLAHQYIDLGADAVIGAHSHVVGDVEVYKGKKIYYSLGNFAFDQYFSEATMNGLGVVLKIRKEGGGFVLNYVDVPIKVNRDGVKTELSTEL
jgi:poly-gamma-glutamate synthesis protein (capsule biosynthesis protein)